MNVKAMAAVLAASVALAGVPGVFAHGGHEHVMGTVKAFAPKTGTLEVQTREGKLVRVHVNEKTRLLRGDAAAKAEDLTPGLRVVIDAGKEEGKLVAREIRLGPAKPVVPK